MIVDAGLLPDDLTQEDLTAALTLLLEDLIGKINPDEATQKLVDLLLNNDLVNTLDGVVLKKVLEIKIYELYGKVASNINAIDKIEIILQVK